MQTPEEIAAGIEPTKYYYMILNVGDQGEIYFNFRPDFSRDEIGQVAGQLRTVLEELTAMEEEEPQEIKIMIEEA